MKLILTFIAMSVLGVGGPTFEYGPGGQRYAAMHQNFRDAMAELKHFKLSKYITL